MAGNRRATLPFGLSGLILALVVFSLIVAFVPWGQLGARVPAPPATRAKPTFETRTVEAGGTASPQAGAGPTQQAALGAAVARYEAKARVGVAAVNLSTRRQVVAGDKTGGRTASIAKVDVLAALLLQRQLEEAELTDEEVADAELAIRSSHNEAADRLLVAAGDASGVMLANQQFGMDATRMEAGDWIDTETTLADQISLLHSVTSPDSVLDGDSRGYLYSLMRTVDEGQEWGVGRVGLDPAVKNGWMHDETDWSKWLLNSIGSTRSPDGDVVLIAIMSEGWTDVDEGIKAMDELAEAALAAVTAR